MTPDLRRHQTSDPVARITQWTVSIGVVSFAAGFFGPIFLSTSNLGPLLGIFVTGPLGVLAGALVGALRVAKNSGRLSIVCIGTVWVMTLLYTLGMLGLSTTAAVPAVPVQFLVIASSIFLFYKRDISVQLPDGLRRSGPIAVAAQVAVLVMTLFLPVISPWWIPTGARHAAAAPLPSFAFILDGRFAAGHHFPEFAVNRGELASEWIITAIVAIGLGLLMQSLRPRPTL